MRLSHMQIKIIFGTDKIAGIKLGWLEKNSIIF